jgi:hypothetical protein
VTNEKGKVAALPYVIDFIGGAEGDRTPDLRIANAALCQTELLPHFKGAQACWNEKLLATKVRIQFQVSGFKFGVVSEPGAIAMGSLRQR